MRLTELDGLLTALFFAVFTSNAVLLRSAGLDSVSMHTRGVRGLGVMALTVTAASVVVEVIVSLLLSWIGTMVEVSTLLEATLVVLTTMLVGYGADVMLKRIAGDREWRWLIFNTAVCGIVLLANTYTHDLGGGLICTLLFSASVVVTYAIVAVVREDMCEHRVPHVFRGVPVLLLLLGLCAMVFEGYSGVSF